MMARAIIATGLVALGLGPAWTLAAAAAARPAIDFHCSVTGQIKGSPQLTREAICARLAAAIEPAIKARLVRVASPPQGAARRWVRIAVRLSPPAQAEAAFTSRLGRAVRNHPPISVDVMDKRLDMREIDMLSRAVAERLHSAG